MSEPKNTEPEKSRLKNKYLVQLRAALKAPYYLNNLSPTPDPLHFSVSTGAYPAIVAADVVVDVYDFLVAFLGSCPCPARHHAIKKLLFAGQRGAKTTEQDLREAIQAIERSIELIPQVWRVASKT